MDGNSAVIVMTPSALQAEAARKAKDWTVGMVAYDQVLAKLKNVGSPSAPASALPDSSLPDAGKTKKRKDTSSDTLRLTKGTKKLKSSRETVKSSVDETASRAMEIADPADSHAEAIADTQEAMAAKASHLARFGRRRAGKNVRRCPTPSCDVADTFSTLQHSYGLLDVSR